MVRGWLIIVDVPWIAVHCGLTSVIVVDSTSSL